MKKNVLLALPHSHHKRRNRNVSPPGDLRHKDEMTAELRVRRYKRARLSVRCYHIYDSASKTWSKLAAWSTQCSCLAPYI